MFYSLLASYLKIKIVRHGSGIVCWVTSTVTDLCYQLPVLPLTVFTLGKKKKEKRKEKKKSQTEKMA